MKLNVRIINYQSIVKILFLFFINFNAVFGCISRQIFKDEDRQTESFLEYQNLQTTLSTISRNIEGNEPQIMTDFQNFLANKYEWRIELDELNFLWYKFKEFSIQNGLIKNTWFKGKRKKYYKHSNATIKFMSDEKIDELLEKEEKRIKISQASNLRRSSSHQDLEKIREEKFKAALAAKIFIKEACAIRRDLFCVPKYFQEKRTGQLFQVFPKGFLVKRCSNECSCVQRSDECLPKSVLNRTEYIYTLTGRQYTEVIYTLNLVDHVDCECRDRCANRRCISNFEKVGSVNSCSCQCITTNEKSCQKILKGHRKISEEDYRCILTGECIPPDCTGGHLTEELLYLRKCPEVAY